MKKSFLTVISIISLLCIIAGCTTTDGTDKTGTSGKTVAPAQSGKITDLYNK